MFKKKKQEVMMSKLLYSHLATLEDNDIKEFSIHILNGAPVFLNLNNLSLIEKNKIINFLQGVVFSIGGISQLIKEDMYIFGPQETFDDNSVMEEIKKRL